MKAGLYARVSKDDQQTLNQLIELREYAKRRGFEVEEFVDEGLSGSLDQDKRPALKNILNAARLRKIDIIVCWRLDRFARSLKQLVDMIGDLETWNVGFTTLRENIDTTTPSGRLVFHIFAALSEFERSLIIERTNLGLRRAVAEGKTLGRPNKAKIISKTGASAEDLIKEIGEMSLRKASAYLNQNGLFVSKNTVARWRKAVPKTPLKFDSIIVGDGGQK